MANAGYADGQFYGDRSGGQIFTPFQNFFGAIKDACQGACAGFLSLMGATHLTAQSSVFGTVGSEVEFLDHLWSLLAANGLAGPVELFAGAALFFSARRTISRTLGVIAFVGFVAAYANGYSLVDMITASSQWLARIALVLEPITQTAPA